MNFFKLFHIFDPILALLSFATIIGNIFTAWQNLFYITSWGRLPRGGERKQREIPINVGDPRSSINPQREIPINIGHPRSSIHPQREISIGHRPSPINPSPRLRSFSNIGPTPSPRIGGLGPTHWKYPPLSRMAKSGQISTTRLIQEFEILKRRNEKIESELHNCHDVLDRQETELETLERSKLRMKQDHDEKFEEVENELGQIENDFNGTSQRPSNKSKAKKKRKSHTVPASSSLPNLATKARSPSAGNANTDEDDFHQQIKKQSEFYAHGKTSLRVQCKVPTKMTGYEQDDEQCPHMDCETGEYRVPIKGKYWFKFCGYERYSDRITWFVCSSEGPRRYEVTHWRSYSGYSSEHDYSYDSSIRFHKVDWECVAGERVWVEGVANEREEKVRELCFSGMLAD